jgi:organic hydroperoxide reductase OsmC/OhrA
MLSQVTQVASFMDVRIERAEMSVRGEFDQKGKFGLSDVPSACTRLTYELDVQSPDSRARMADFMAALERSCYTTNTLKNPVEVVAKLRVNGTEIPL